MPSFVNRLSRFARSPQGQRLARQAQRYAARPENRRKVMDLRRRMSKRP